MEVKMIEVEKIKMFTEENGRINFRRSLGDVTDLIANMKERVAEGKCPNVLPIIVTKLEGDENYDYLVVDGKRRVQACLTLRVPKMLAVITKETDKTKLRNISYLANQYKKDMDWIEQGYCFRSFIDEGLSATDISKMLTVSKTTLSRYLAGLVLLEEIRSVARCNNISIPPEVPDIHNVLLLKHLKEIKEHVEDYDIQTDLVPFYLYCVEGELNRSDAAKSMLSLANFHTALYTLRCNGYEELANRLYEKYFKYRYVPQIIGTVFKKELELCTGQTELIDWYLDKEEYPTRESANEFANSLHGRVVREIHRDGWHLRVLPYNMAEIDKQFRKLKEKYAQCDD